jgi:predicted DCC family thiol-disulfide oxidoreductase YuxK
VASKPRLVYDGVCNLCVGVVKFLNVVDHKHTIEYAAYQRLDSRFMKRYQLRVVELQGRMHLINCDGSLVRGAAAITAACRLLAPVTVICELFNTPIAKRLYDFIAGRRYRLFGCRDSCYAPGNGNHPKISRP